MPAGGRHPRPRRSPTDGLRLPPGASRLGTGLPRRVPVRRTTSTRAPVLPGRADRQGGRPAARAPRAAGTEHADAAGAERRRRGPPELGPGRLRPCLRPPGRATAAPGPARRWDHPALRPDVVGRGPCPRRRRPRRASAAVPARVTGIGGQLRPADPRPVARPPRGGTRHAGQRLLRTSARDGPRHRGLRGRRRRGARPARARPGDRLREPHGRLHRPGAGRPPAGPGRDRGGRRPPCLRRRRAGRSARELLHLALPGAPRRASAARLAHDP